MKFVTSASIFSTITSTPLAFGCMPSSQSDGVQSAVINKFKDMIFLPIETSGEGEINAHSRVQMALGEAKSKAKKEFAEVLQRTGRALD